MFKRSLIAAGIFGLSAVALAAETTLPAVGGGVKATDEKQTEELTTPAPAESTTTIERSDQGATVKNRANVPGKDSGSANSASSESLISINKAGASELSSRLGLTSEQANAIIDFRRQNGPLKSDSDLRDVKGLDAATIKRLKGKIEFAKTDDKVKAGVKSDDTKADAEVEDKTDKK